jgi:Ni/Co efflux regulator RcnB
MKSTAIVCAVLAGTFGFSTIASAEGWRDHNRRDRNDRVEQRHDRRDARQDRRHDRRDARHDRRDDRRHDRNWNQGYRIVTPQYRAPTYRYVQPARHQRFHRGGYLPYQYRNHGYYVSNWQAYPGLYAPPYGQQWVNVDGEFLLVALTTGLILNALIN